MPFGGWELDQRIEYILISIDRIKSSMEGIDTGEPLYHCMQNMVYELGQILINSMKPINEETQEKPVNE